MSTISYSHENPIREPAEWFTAQVDYFSKKREAFLRQVQLIDNRDPENPIRTVNDTVQDVAGKCFMILIALPFYTVGVMLTHAVRCFTLMGSHAAKGEFTEAFLSLIQEVWAVAKSPIYAFAIAFYAVIGMICPLTMRSVIGQLERDWSGSERFYDWRRKTGDDLNAALTEYFTHRTSKTTFFLAFCFQPMGKLHDAQRVRGYQVLDPT
jgi:hypothetical protein